MKGTGKKSLGPDRQVRGIGPKRHRTLQGIHPKIRRVRQCSIILIIETLFWWVEIMSTPNWKVFSSLLNIHTPVMLFIISPDLIISFIFF